MTWNVLIRQGHRWVSIAFTAIVAALFLAMGIGKRPADWVYALPLIPLALLVGTGLHLFVAPYAARRRGRRFGR